MLLLNVADVLQVPWSFSEDSIGVIRPRAKSVTVAESTMIGHRVRHRAGLTTSTDPRQDRLARAGFSFNLPRVVCQLLFAGARRGKLGFYLKRAWLVAV
jgi:hypothetical protein